MALGFSLEQMIQILKPHSKIPERTIGFIDCNLSIPGRGL
jgi:hypothetical protein